MKRVLIFIALTVAPFMLSAQQLHTTLDILHPAKYTLPDSVLDLIVVNNTLPQPWGLGHSTKMEEQTINNIEIDLSKASTYLLLGATQTLDESQLFATVGFVPESYNHTNNFMEQKLLPLDTIRHLCYEYQANGTLVCNRLLLYDVLGTYLTEDYTYFAYLDAYLVSNWTIQLPNGKYQTFTYNDTLTWEAEGDSKDAAIRALPPRQIALLDMCRYAGEQFGQRFLPKWETVDRYFYENEHTGIQRGIDALTHQRWDEAVDIWTVVYDQTIDATKKQDKLSCAYAAANAAVGYEIMDNLTAAHAWAEKAVQAFAKVGTADAIQQGINLQYYARQLTERIKENQL